MLRYFQHTTVKQNLLYLACDWVTNCLIKHKSLIMIDIFSQIFTHITVGIQTFDLNLNFPLISFLQDLDLSYPTKRTYLIKLNPSFK